MVHVHLRMGRFVWEKWAGGSNFDMDSQASTKYTSYDLAIQAGKGQPPSSIAQACTNILSALFVIRQISLSMLMKRYVPRSKLGVKPSQGTCINPLMYVYIHVLVQLAILLGFPIWMTIHQRRCLDPSQPCEFGTPSRGVYGQSGYGYGQNGYNQYGSHQKNGPRGVQSGQNGTLGPQNRT